MAFLFRLIKSILVNSFKFINAIRLILLNVIFIMILLFLFASYDGDEIEIEVAENSYLRLDLNGFIVEKKQPMNFSQEVSKQLSGFANEAPEEFEVQEIIKTIQYAKNDQNITGLVLELSGLQAASINQLTDIGSAITQFKSAGKPVYAYADNYSQTQYYLAAYADQVTLPPNGFVLLQGYAVNRLYFKDLLDKLLITPHVFKVGTYKSFVEPYTEDHMSEYSKTANQHWLNQLWQNYIDHVLLARKNNPQISERSINPTLAEVKQGLKAVNGDTSEYALSVGLVDNLLFHDQFLKNMANDAQQTQNSKPSMISYRAYQSTLPDLYRYTGEESQIAVIHGSGEIISGLNTGSTIADKSFNALLKRAKNNPHIKAIVLRLDTPGGSAFASENIRQQVLALKNAGKKVVVSMGAVTASGGYWIASAADKIIASPTTLTGSIGIFGMFATLDKTLNEMGIQQDGVATNPLANIGITQALDPQLAEIFQLGIENGYANFLKVVSEGRGMSLADVDKVAQGRVWTGVDGVQNGLVDQLGGLQYAVQQAAQLADLDDFDVISIEPRLSSKEVFFNQLFAKSIKYLPSGVITQPTLVKLFTDIEQQANFISRINDPQSRFVYCTQCYIK
ncbi:signal peptide peptidase SppA [Psychromonas sp. B3M02]|uniref:signal peptide peptidase SppA n=1 Tax=Psychromonas sp. B3M02 TaxID=2267226 RepID=UPI000DEBF26E|nr:signal peptide peptidase SppA [Psychromonas sp. B3M02]RBW47166.1 signal peptide peptidase SppA [Psychromonas sp. B3M02]